ncbi:MAG: hypothetical protein AAES65_19480 [Candidatus Thiodiazotropha sp. (ex. Lucinoma kazani)]
MLYFRSRCWHARSLATALAGSAPAEAGEIFNPMLFCASAADSSVTVLCVEHLEMGQGTYTGMATLVAEELDADWEQVSF